MGQLGPCRDYTPVGGRQPGMSMVVHGVIWDNWDQGLYTGCGETTWDVHGCPWCNMGQLGPGTIHRLGGDNNGMSMVVHGVIWENPHIPRIT